MTDIADPTTQATAPDATTTTATAPVYTAPTADELLRAYQVPAEVPLTVTLRQFKLALVDLGFYDAVDQAATKDKVPWIYWMSPGEVERVNDFVLQMAVGLGLDGQALDKVFVLAGTK